MVSTWQLSLRGVHVAQDPSSMRQSNAPTGSSCYRTYRCTRRRQARRPWRTTPMRCSRYARDRCSVSSILIIGREDPGVRRRRGANTARAAFHIRQVPTPSLFGRCSSCSTRAAVGMSLLFLLAISTAAGAHLTHDLLTTYSRLTHDILTTYHDLLTSYARPRVTGMRSIREASTT